MCPRAGSSRDAKAKPKFTKFSVFWRVSWQCRVVFFSKKIVTHVGPKPHNFVPVSGRAFFVSGARLNPHHRYINPEPKACGICIGAVTCEENLKIDETVKSPLNLLQINREPVKKEMNTT